MVFTTVTYSQTSRQVIDKNTVLPVPFATIKLINKKGGVITSEKGEFHLQFNPDDSVLISCVGYYPIILIGKDIRSTISLAPKFKSLANVTIQSHIIVESVLIGDRSKKYEDIEYWGPGGLNLKEEFAQKMELPDSTSSYKIKKIFIPSKKIRCQGPLFLRIYTADTISQLPGEEILIKMIPGDKMKYQKKKLLIDVSEENIYLDSVKYFFISIGWPEDTYSSNCITVIVTYRKSQQKSYTRGLNCNDYKWWQFGFFNDRNGNSYQATTVYSALLDKLK
jgi:hypothetical protein